MKENFQKPKTSVDTREFKEKLEVELKTVEDELKTVGHINPSNPGDWEAQPEKNDTVPADTNDVAEDITEYETNTAVLKELEIRFNEIKGALKKIQEENYGYCEIDGEPIEMERLKANPAATTCIKHMAK